MDSIPLAKSLFDNLAMRLSEYGLKLLGAIAVWIIGRAFIRFGLGLLVSRLEKQKVDHTIVGYARNTLSVALNIALAVVLMGVLGIETASFAAFIAGAGLAIGAAWSGLLSNFAAGAFLVVLRPFRSGETVTAAGVTGKVDEVGLFVTSLVPEDNVRTYIGNAKVLGSILRNYNSTTARRIDLLATAPRNQDLHELTAKLYETVSKVPNVLTTPAPEIVLIGFSIWHYRIAIRPYVKPDDYWQTIHSITPLLLPHLESVTVARAVVELEADEFEAGEEAEAGDED